MFELDTSFDPFNGTGLGGGGHQPPFSLPTTVAGGSYPDSVDYGDIHEFPLFANAEGDYVPETVDHAPEQAPSSESDAYSRDETVSISEGSEEDEEISDDEEAEAIPQAAASQSLIHPAFSMAWWDPSRYGTHSAPHEGDMESFEGYVSPPLSTSMSPFVFGRPWDHSQHEPDDSPLSPEIESALRDDLDAAGGLLKFGTYSFPSQPSSPVRTASPAQADDILHKASIKNDATSSGEEASHKASVVDGYLKRGAAREAAKRIAANSRAWLTNHGRGAKRRDPNGIPPRSTSPENHPSDDNVPAATPDANGHRRSKRMRK